MKLIEGLKEVKRLNKKLDDLRMKVNKHCAHSSLKEPEYGDKQRDKVREWIQSYHDTVQRILDLRVAIQRTNLETEVTIELEDKQVTKTIAAWIHRRRDLANRDADLYRVLNDDHVETGTMHAGRGRNPRSEDDLIEVTSITYYDPELRDRKLSAYSDEPSLIDAKLEIVNAVTDIIGID